MPGECKKRVAVADVMPTGKGTYAAFFHDDGRFLKEGGRGTPGFEVYAIDSLDGGVTWGAPRVVAVDPSVHLCVRWFRATPLDLRFLWRI